jgi:formylglycine-generating enzyme required for sulfatase activity
MASVGGRFCVDRWEGSLVVRGDDGATSPWPPHEIPAGNRAFVARSASGVLPQAYISGAIAGAACKRAGKRLCHAVEWRAACGGSQGYAYPYGPKRIPAQCKDSGTAPMMQLHADTMKRGWGMAELNDPLNDQLPGTVALTGSHPRCVSDQGVFDMVGNLHEWTADPNGTFQGGFWLDTREHGDGCAYRTIAHGFGYHDYSTGFRCCRDPG